MQDYGSFSNVAPIRRMLLKSVREAFLDAGNVERQWRELNYTGCPDYQGSLREYDQLVAIFEDLGIELMFLPTSDRTGLDSIYVHDPVIVVRGGAILCNMGKTERAGEPSAVGEFLLQQGVPILGSISGDARLEGGDMIWLDERTIAVGEGYRSNAEGIWQLREILKNQVDEVIAVPMPHWRGPADVLHLMSIISPIDVDLAVVYSPLMPVVFRETLLKRGFQLLEVTDAEYERMGCNVLAVAPRKCVMLAGNPEIQGLLEGQGVEVFTYEGREISYRGCGGPTCLTRPILRV